MLMAHMHLWRSNSEA